MGLIPFASRRKEGFNFNLSPLSRITSTTAIWASDIPEKRKPAHPLFCGLQHSYSLSNRNHLLRTTALSTYRPPHPAINNKMGHFKFGPNKFSGDDEEEDDESEEDEDGESGSLVPRYGPTTKICSEQQEEVIIEEEKEDERKQAEDQALAKEEESQAEYCNSEDEDNDAELASLVPQAYQTTKGDHAEQKEAVVDEDYDYDSEEDEDDALEREVSWRLWEMSDATNISPGKPAMSTGAVESTSDGSLTDSNREPDAKSIRVREKVLHQLQFLKFGGDRDTKPSTVDWFLQLVAETFPENRGEEKTAPTAGRYPGLVPGQDSQFTLPAAMIGSSISEQERTCTSLHLRFPCTSTIHSAGSSLWMHSWTSLIQRGVKQAGSERMPSTGEDKSQAYSVERRVTDEVKIPCESQARSAERRVIDEAKIPCESQACPVEKMQVDSVEKHLIVKTKRADDGSRRTSSQQIRFELSNSTDALRAQQRQSDRQPQDNNILQIGSAFRYRPQDFGQCEKDSEKGLALEKRVALLEKHIVCLEWELKAIHTKSSIIGIALEKQGLSHCCRVCPQTFGSGTQLHRHLRNFKHFSPPPSPAFRLEDVGTSSDSVPTSVLVATLEVSDAAARGDFIPTGPFSSAVLTASTPSSDALQDTSNHTASESDWQASLKRSRDKPVNELALKTPDFKATEVAPPQKISLQTQACRLLNDCSTEPEPTIVTAGTPLHAESVALKKSDETAKWQKEAQNQQALATKWQLACKIPDCNLPNLATLDVDLEDIRPLSVNAGATDWQQNAKDWTSLVTKWRNRYNTIQELVQKIPTYKPTKICPAGPTPSSLLARTNSYNTPIILTVDTPQDSTRAPQRDPTSTQLLADEDCVSTSRSCPGSAASEDLIPAGPFSSAVLTAPLRNALQAKIPNLAGLYGEVQLKADTSNHTAPESDREASLKPTTRSLTS
ncbi:hypothetical protein FN846DRAFT_896631 [Sphaerosporella brunnea]|uniref:C2H2-type domain-containing protein n=1 Tax=Sphaerosporella brunnea TaxID=1250544 RepID=A0A5J5ED67_9PEZI|nr:hypothetical protein FN846DRAFT_896631 [Sphaerosporella brunnea]